MAEPDKGSRRPSAKRRCAIYTRKSTDEGLDQAFNSLDAQREACDGGQPPLGYDVKDRKLVVNEAEAEAVRHIFQRYCKP